MPSLEGVGALCRAYLASLRLPAQTIEGPGCRVVRLDRALIHHCVADARAKGAEDVLIGAIAGDPPKHAYAAMGFASTCLIWEWLKAPKS